MVYVFDACAIFAYLNNEEGADTIEQLLSRPLRTTTLLIHSINACEIYYLTYRAYGRQAADDVIETLRSIAVVIREDMDIGFLKLAGRLNAVYGQGQETVGLADCAATALAIRVNGTIVTSNGHFIPLQEQNICKVSFFKEPLKKRLITPILETA